VWRLVGNGLKKGRQIQGDRDYLSVLVILGMHGSHKTCAGGRGAVGSDLPVLCMTYTQKTTI